MKKIALIALAAIAALVSCQKNELPADNARPEGIPMTLNATIGNDTKTTYTPDGNVLKTSWDAIESISVMTLSGDAVYSIDNFTSNGEDGRKSAVFSGTYTGKDAENASVIVIYPALIAMAADGSEDISNYHTLVYTSGEDTYSIIDGISLTTPGEDSYCQSNVYPLTQVGNGSTDHLQNYCLMTGEVDKTDLQDNVITTTLSHEFMIFKIVLDAPSLANDTYSGSVTINAFDGKEESHKRIFGSATSWQHMNIAANGFVSNSLDVSSLTINCNSAQFSSEGQLVLYLPVRDMGSVSDGESHCSEDDFWEITFEEASMTAEKIFSKDMTFEKGKMYTINISEEEIN